MFDLTISEELILPVPLECAREVCERVLLMLDWNLRDHSPTTLFAREKSFLGMSKTLTTPMDVTVLLSASGEATHAKVSMAMIGGKSMAFIFRPVIQGRLGKIRERLQAEIPGARSAEGHSAENALHPAPFAPSPLPLRQSLPMTQGLRNLQPPPEPASSTRAAGRIFISYRRSDSADVAGRIYDRLTGHFGDGAVFQDVEDIPLGMDFSEHITAVVSKCDAFLAIIGPRWLDAVDDQGRRRLDNPADNVRIEIESGLNRKIPLIPILVSGAAMPREAALPDTLRKLAFRNATPVRPNPDFRADMARLIEGLEELFTRRG